VVVREHIIYGVPFKDCLNIKSNPDFNPSINLNTNTLYIDITSRGWRFAHFLFLSCHFAHYKP